MATMPDDFSALARRTEMASARALGTFIDGLLKQIERDAPKYSSDKQPPYDFSASIAYVRDHFPVGCDIPAFKRATIAAVEGCLGSGTFPVKTRGGWLLGVMAAAFLQTGQQNVILQDVLGDLRTTLTKGDHIFSFGHYIHPAILDVLPAGEARDKLLADVVVYASDRSHDKMEICGFNMVMDSHLSDIDHFGPYNFTDEKREIAQAFIDRLGVPALVQWFAVDGPLKLRFSALSDLFKFATPEQAHAMANELVAQVDSNNFARNFQSIFSQDVSKAGSFPLSAFRFFHKFMQSLPDEKREEYGSALIDHLGPKNAVWVVNRELKWSSGFNTEVRDFIDGFAKPQAERLLALLVAHVMAINPAVSVEDYQRAPDHHWNEGKFAISLHDVVPAAYWDHYEACVLEALEKPDCPPFAWLSASQLLSGHLTRDKQRIRTREIDFYPTQTAYATSGAVGHIKPARGQNSLGMVTTGSFVGTLGDYFETVSNPQPGGSRYYPPHLKPLDRPERYLKLYPEIQAAEEEALAGGSTLPTLHDYLHKRWG